MSHTDTGDQGDDTHTSKESEGYSESKRLAKGKGLNESLGAEEMKSVMYGFGEESLEPLKESLDLLNDIVVEYIEGVTIELCMHALSASASSDDNTDKFNNNDEEQQQKKKQHKLKLDGEESLDALLHVIRKDEAKSERAKELINIAEEIKKAKNVHLGGKVKS